MRGHEHLKSFLFLLLKKKKKKKTTRWFPAQSTGQLLVATGLVVLRKLDSNLRFFDLCELEIWWTTSKNNRAPFLYFIKLCASLQSHRWIQTRVTVRKRSIRVNIVCWFFVPCDLEIWRMTFKIDMAPLLYYIKLFAPFQSHRWIQTGVTARKALFG